MVSNLNRGSVWWVRLDPTQGSEINKLRPCVILGATPINQARRTVVVVPLSTASREGIPPITVSVNCMGKQVVAVCDQIRAVDKKRLTEYVESLTNRDMDAISEALRTVLVL
ncbi:MAG: type II toxin-antitoxin system PemK/MazF family toxin [Desulfatirhabdiaceae bacterium]